MWMYLARGSTVPMWSLYNWPVLLCHWLNIWQQVGRGLAEIGGQGGVYADRQCGAVPHFRASYTAMELGCYVPGTDGGKGEFARTDEL